MTESTSHLRVIEETPGDWRVVFDNPPLSPMDADMFEGLQALLARMDASPSLRVVVFESANPDFYLAHFEVKDTARTLTLLPNGRAHRPPPRCWTRSFVSPSLRLSASRRSGGAPV